MHPMKKWMFSLDLEQRLWKERAGYHNDRRTVHSECPIVTLGLRIRIPNAGNVGQSSAFGHSFFFIIFRQIFYPSRYYDKMEKEYAMFGGVMPARASNRYSQQSRYSDTVPLRRHSPAIKPRSTSQNSGARHSANANSYQGRYRVPGRWCTTLIGTLIYVMV